MILTPSLERLIIMLFLSTLVHVGGITGIGFISPIGKEQPNPPIEVMLVQRESEKAPEEADYLAQASQEGGGENQQKNRPATPVEAPFPDKTAEVVATPPPPKKSTPTQQSQIAKIATEQLKPHKVKPQENISPTEEPAFEELGEELEEPEISPPVPTSTLIANARASIASIQAEIDKKFDAYAQRPRHKFISASTREYNYANYMYNWEKRIERIGDLNFPEEAARQQLSGTLVLDVAINPNGTIYAVSIKRVSQHEVFNLAAKRIVHLAAPFAPFPQSIREETDILHITRTWEFSYDSLSTR